MSEIGCRTVVSSGQMERARCVSSKPQTVKSAGTSRWRRCATDTAPPPYRHYWRRRRSADPAIPAAPHTQSAPTVGEETLRNERFVHLYSSFGERPAVAAGAFGAGRWSGFPQMNPILRCPSSKMWRVMAAAAAKSSMRKEGVRRNGLRRLPRHSISPRTESRYAAWRNRRAVGEAKLLARRRPRAPQRPFSPRRLALDHR